MAFLIVTTLDNWNLTDRLIFNINTTKMFSLEVIVPINFCTCIRIDKLSDLKEGYVVPMYILSQFILNVWKKLINIILYLYY